MEPNPPPQLHPPHPPPAEISPLLSGRMVFSRRASLSFNFTVLLHNNVFEFSVIQTTHDSLRLRKIYLLSRKEQNLFFFLFSSSALLGRLSANFTIITRVLKSYINMQGCHCSLGFCCVCVWCVYIDCLVLQIPVSGFRFKPEKCA